MKVRQLLLLLLLNFSLLVSVRSQCVPIVSPSTDCETAPAICLNQLCFFTTNTPQTCCNNWCGNNTIINNPQFFYFTPGQPDVEIDILVDSCTNGVGLQSAILDNCPWDNTNVITCNPGVPPGATMMLQTTGLIPGTPYWLLIDGSNGAVCYYTITNTSGIDFPLLTDTLDPVLSFPGDSLVCPGYQHLLLTTGPDILGANYQWTLGWNGEKIITADPTLTVDVDPDSPEGSYTVCVRALNGCDSTNQVCFQVEIGSIPSVTKDTAIFCAEEFPVFWNGQVVFGPGDYTATLTNEHGCSFDTTWTVLEYPTNPPGVIDTFVCASQFTFHGQRFDQSGYYFVVLPGENSNGCDSMVELNLMIGASAQFVEVACENNQMVLKTHITAQDENIDTVTLEWYTCSFDSILSTAADFIPDSSGCYSLVINSGQCRDTISSSYYNSGCIINDLCYFNTSPTCAGESTLITPVFQVPDQTQIHWLIDFPGAPGTYYGDSDSIYVTFPEAGTYPVSYTLQDSAETWSCHSMMVVNASPEVSLCCDVFTCDSCAFITLSNHSADTVYIALTYGAPFTLSGNDMMNIEICSPEGFPLDIGIDSISSAENGCAGTIAGDTSVRINPLPPALVFIVPIDDTLCTYPNDLASYQWRYCDSTEILSTANCFAPSASGCYCLDVANDAGCTYETCMPFFLSGTSSIAKEEFQISPNPSQGNIQIKLPTTLSLPVPWQLTNTAGKILRYGELNEKESSLDFNTLPSGMYLIKFNIPSQGVITRKVLLE